MNHQLYIHITEQCKNEARTFNLLDQLEKLKARVERDQNLMQFEVFEFPYQVKKYFAYQYRLVTHLQTIHYENKDYRILTFLKIYHRGDKSYEKWYINAKQYGDSVYKQRNVAKEIDELLPILAQQDDDIQYVQSEYLYLLRNYRVDILRLGHQPSEYYQETLTWQYDIAPKLSPELLQKHHTTLFHAIEKHENTVFHFDNKQIKNIIPPFQQYEPIIYQPHIQCAMQDNPPYLGLKAENHDNYHRAVPLELAYDDKLWSLAQQTHLPFQLNALQQQCIDSLFNKYQSYPFIVQADKNTGKTTLLALLYAHFYVQEPIENVLPCLFLCEEHEIEYLHHSIKNYIQLCQDWHPLPEQYKNIQQVLNKSCISLKKYLWQHLNIEQKKQFCDELYIDENKFYQMYHAQFTQQYSKEVQLSVEISPLIWRVIKYCIKGTHIDKPALNNKLAELLTEDEFQFIYDKVYKNWYLPLQQNQKYWDIQDLISYIDQYDIPLTPYSALLCENSQRYSEIGLSFILKQNYWIKNGHTEQISQIPLIFMSYNSPEDYIHSWQEQLYRILNEIIHFNQYDNQNASALKPIIPYIYQDRINSITSLFNYYYNFLGLSKHIIQDPHETPTIPNNIYFVSEEKKEYIIPLLQQHVVEWVIYDDKYRIINKYWQDDPKYTDKFFHQFYDARIMKRSSHLPNKNKALILVNFDCILHEFYQYLEYSEYATPMQRYRMECLLHDLEIALQQGLQDIFIVSGHKQYFKLWQDFFYRTHLQNNLKNYQAMVQYRNPNQENSIQFKAVEFSDIEQFYTVHHKELPEPDTPLLHYVHLLKNNKIEQSIISEKIYYFECHFQENDQFDYEVISYYSLNKIDSFFKKFRKHRFQYKMIALFLVLEDLENLRKYSQFMPEYFKIHFDSLVLTHDTEPSTLWVELFIQLYERILKQPVYQYNHHDVWLDFWSRMNEGFYQQFLLCPQVSQELYHKIYQQVYYARQEGLLYSLPVLALIKTRLHKYVEAIQDCEYLREIGVLHNYPFFYHQAKMQTIEHIGERLDYLLFVLDDIEPRFKVEELLKMNLNELQAEYWEKILQYLYEEDELEPILSHLLPSIDSQDVLERLYQFCKMNPDTEAFSVRVRRIKTLWASLSNDWFIIEDRLEHFKPINNFEDIRHSLMAHFQNVQQNKNRQKNKVKNTYTFDEEVLDILYALNLSQKIYVPTSLEAWQEYKKFDRVNTVFELLKNIFALTKDDEDLTWKTGFQSIRALCCLMEKSPNLEMPFSLYLQLLHEYNEKEVLYPFFLERLFVISKRIQIYEADNTELLENVQRFETKFKKELQKFNVDNLELNPPVLKYVSELLKSILAISPKENQILQQLEREEAKEKERLEAQRLAKEEAQRLEAERLAREAQQRLEAERIAEEQRLEAERIAREEQQRLEAERIAEEQRLEAERIAEKQRIEAERIAEEQRIEEERLAREEQQRLEAERLAKEEAQRLEAERLAREEQQRLENERLAQTETVMTEPENIAQQTTTETISVPEMTQAVASTPIPPTANVTPSPSPAPSHLNFTPAPLFEMASRKATTEMVLFGLRIFVSRVHQRLNIEDVNTGERWSLQLNSQHIQSDWQYQQQQNMYHISALRINIIVLSEYIQIQHLEYGISTQIQL